MASMNTSDAVSVVPEYIMQSAIQWWSEIIAPTTNPRDIWTWNKTQVTSFWTIIVIGVEILSYFVLNFKFLTTKRIEAGAHPLESLSLKDRAFILFNRLTIPMMFYHMMGFLVGYHHVFAPETKAPHIQWDMDAITVYNSLFSLVGLFLVYDFFYVAFHRLLHVRGLYKFIHKHHHRQGVPSRGNVDAVNVHPFEFLTGEYLHILSMYLVPSHILACFAFILIGAVLASLNHTRFDLSFLGIYDVKAHDVHHRLPLTNYGQYTMFWDRLFGSFRPYEESRASLRKKKKA